MEYSQELAKDYSQKREQFNETDMVFLDALKKIGVEGKTIVDLGCGDGRHARLIKEMGASRVIGLDVSEKMIEIAKEKTVNTEDVQFLVADGSEIPLEEGVADIVVSNFVIHYFSDADEVFSEISRILKQDGYCVVTLNITDVEVGYEHLYNKEMPIRLGQGDDAVIVQNLIKSRKEIEDAVAHSGLVIQEEKELDHPNATIDDAFADKSHVTKNAIMVVLQKVGELSGVGAYVRF